MKTHGGLLEGLGNSLAPPAPVDTNDPASLRMQAQEMLKRGNVQEAQVYTNMANQMERKRALDNATVEARTERTLARGDQRRDRAAAMMAEGQKELETAQAMEKWNKSKQATAAALRKQGRGSLADIVEATEDPAALRGMMGVIAADPKAKEANWKLTELEDGQYAVNMDNPNQKVRVGSVYRKPEKGSEATSAVPPQQRAMISDQYEPLWSAFDRIKENYSGPATQWSTAWFPGSDAGAVEGALDTIGANVAFDRLQQMRDESKTGGALGQVSNYELQLLKAVKGNLDPTKKGFMENLEQVEEIYRRTAALDHLVSRHGEDNIAELRRTPDGMGYLAKLKDGTIDRYPPKGE